MMKILARAIVTGFGLAVGAALYKKVAKELGLDTADPRAQQPAPAHADGTAGPVHS